MRRVDAAGLHGSLFNTQLWIRSHTHTHTHTHEQTNKRMNNIKKKKEEKDSLFCVHTRAYSAKTSLDVSASLSIDLSFLVNVSPHSVENNNGYKEERTKYTHKHNQSIKQNRSNHPFSFNSILPQASSALLLSVS